MKAFARFLWNLPGEFLIFLVRIYQWTLSPLIGRQCRFQPTCSHYYIGAVRKYGAIRGSWKGLVRIIRCNPWGGSGYDPP
ncbi:membrane protein insertion efficiency factor YidD [bacterium]|uniref:membrane protein insertion efficiency factor YidD n=1 Tax=Rubinisphaera sp. JC750 TaxID=2898658 RepID=UPI001F162D33|nr:membrane protein insertion efficiency factor YidD [Rubinisphaera sp. JC750]MBR9801049.1 membrane protein insertion efficiency factor YidD [bacterium]